VARLRAAATAGRHSGVVATVLLRRGWAGWHIPLFLYRPGYASMNAAGIAGWLTSLLTGAILLTWLFNRSHGSVLVVALFHAAVDVVFASDVTSPVVVMLAGVLITLWGLAVLAVEIRHPGGAMRWGTVRIAPAGDATPGRPDGAANPGASGRR
jgi:hypothetical protein